MQKLIDPIIALWNRIDPKLKYTVLTAAVAWVVTKYAIELDPTLSAVIAGVIASAAGYKVENDGTLLREGILDDGNPNPDAGVHVPPGE